MDDNEKMFRSFVNSDARSKTWVATGEPSLHSRWPMGMPMRYKSDSYLSHGFSSTEAPGIGAQDITHPGRMLTGSCPGYANHFSFYPSPMNFPFDCQNPPQTDRNYQGRQGFLNAEFMACGVPGNGPYGFPFRPPYSDPRFEAWESRWREPGGRGGIRNRLATDDLESDSERSVQVVQNNDRERPPKKPEEFNTRDCLSGRPLKRKRNNSNDRQSKKHCNKSRSRENDSEKEDAEDEDCCCTFRNNTTKKFSHSNFFFGLAKENTFSNGPYVPKVKKDAKDMENQKRKGNGSGGNVQEKEKVKK